MTNAFDFDLEASRVARADGEPVGVCTLGVRGDEAWIGGLGVVAAARREGIGETLMRATLDEARRRGIREVRLEVIRENERAIPPTSGWASRRRGSWMCGRCRARPGGPRRSPQRTRMT